MKMSILKFIGVKDQETSLFLVGITDCPCCMSMCKSLGIFYGYLHPDYMFSRYKLKPKGK